jgi:hypothetical protein
MLVKDSRGRGQPPFPLLFSSLLALNLRRLIGENGAHLGIIYETVDVPFRPRRARDSETIWIARY